MAAKRRPSAREIKKSRATELIESIEDNLAIAWKAFEAAKKQLRALKEITRAAPDREPPQCSDSSHPSQGQN